MYPHSFRWVSWAIYPIYVKVRVIAIGGAHIKHPSLGLNTVVQSYRHRFAPNQTLQLNVFDNKPDRYDVPNPVLCSTPMDKGIKQ